MLARHTLLYTMRCRATLEPARASERGKKQSVLCVGTSPTHKTLMSLRSP